MRYFIDVVNFVDNHIIWIAGLFLLACFIEFIVFLLIKKSGKFDTDGLFICFTTNLVITLGLYILVCLGVGLINCLRDQNWHFWTKYIAFLKNGGVALIGIVYAGSVIFLLFKLHAEIESFFGRLVVAALLSAIVAGLAFIAGLIIYIVLAFLIIILKVIWFVVSGFFISIFQFVVKYWKMVIVVLIGPGIIYGACCAFLNYVSSLRKEVAHK